MTPPAYSPAHGYRAACSADREGPRRPAAGCHRLCRPSSGGRSEGLSADVVRDLANRVGGLDALEQLDDAPIADEPFDWSVVPDGHQAFVRDVLATIDETCDRWLDVEYRTIARRLLARELVHDSKPLRRSKSPDRVVAGVVHAVLAGNGELGRRTGRFRAVDVAGRGAACHRPGTSRRHSCRPLRSSVPLTTATDRGITTPGVTSRWHRPRCCTHAGDVRCWPSARRRSRRSRPTRRGAPAGGRSSTWATGMSSCAAVRSMSPSCARAAAAQGRR